ncbi:MAG: MarC family protein [bacterium]
MTEFLRVALFLVAAVNPAAVASAPPPGMRLSRQVIVGGFAFAAIALGLAAILSSRILSGLGVEPETFRVAAGVVLMVGGGLAVWNGGSPHRGPWEGRGAALFPLGMPLLVTPGALAASISYGADHGAVRTVLGALIALTVAVGLLAGAAGRYRPVLDGVARVTGGLLIAIGVGLVVDGVRAI